MPSISRTLPGRPAPQLTLEVRKFLMASPVRIFFMLAFALTWGIGGLALLAGLWMPGWQGLSTSSPLYYLAGYSVSLAGIALTARYAGREGLRRLGAVPPLTPLQEGVRQTAERFRHLAQAGRLDVSDLPN